MGALVSPPAPPSRTHARPSRLAPGHDFHVYISYGATIDNGMEQTARTVRNRPQSVDLKVLMERDGVTKFDEEAVCNVMARCCVLVVCLSDGSFRNVGCHLHWRTVLDVCMPVLCLVDASKHAVTDLKDSAADHFPPLLNQGCVVYEGCVSTLMQQIISWVTNR